MKSIINELWHGNIVPQEDSRNNTKEMKELISYIARHDEDLGKLLTEEQKAIFEKYQDCWNEYVSLAEAAIFEYAFKLGMTIAIETLTNNEYLRGVTTRLPLSCFITTIKVKQLKKSQNYDII